MTEGALLHGTNIVKDYPARRGNEALRVLNGIDIEIPRKSILCIVGASGSGKSTLLHVLSGLDRPTEGNVFYENRDLGTLKDDELAYFRNHSLGFVFQFHHLLPEFTALENVFIPALLNGGDKEELIDRAHDLLRRFNIDHRYDHRPTELSGGEQQRVALARALMNHPRIIMADEPTGNLDETNTKSMLDLLFGLRDDEQISIVMATHDRDLIRHAEHVFRLSKGKLTPLS